MMHLEVLSSKSPLFSNSLSLGFSQSRPHDKDLVWAFYLGAMLGSKNERTVKVTQDKVSHCGRVGFNEAGVL
jgi:hypothetical protein